MKFEIKHLLGAAVIIAVGLTVRDQIHFEILSLVVTHLLLWWLADLKLLNPRFLKIPTSVILIAASCFGVLVVVPSGYFHSEFGEVWLIATIVLVCRIFLDPPQAQNSRLIVGYCLFVSVGATLLTANFDGDTVHFLAMWLMATVGVGLIHLKLRLVRTNRIRWLDKTASFFMWSGLIGLGIAILTICVCITRNNQTPDFGNLVVGVVAYLVGVTSWIAISVGVASNLIANPAPPVLKTGSFQLVCIGGVAAQLAFDLI